MTHAVVEWLLSSNTIKNMVGNNDAGDTHKVYQAFVPQDEKPPYICVRVMEFTPWTCKGQAATEEVDAIQVDCYANSYQDAYTLYRAARQVIDGQSFTATDGTQLSGTIRGGRDYTESEMLEVGKRGVYGIVSTYDVEVHMGEIT